VAQVQIEMFSGPGGPPWYHSCVFHRLARESRPCSMTCSFRITLQGQCVRAAHFQVMPLGRGVAMVLPTSLPIVVTLLSACSSSAPQSQVTPLEGEQLTCGSNAAPFAVYHRAIGRSAELGDSLSSLIVRAIDRVRSTHVRLADVQLWGAGWGAGGPTDSLGIAEHLRRPPGLHSLALRREPRQEDRWVYAVTLRAGYVDTVVVDLAAPCTQIWRGS